METIFYMKDTVWSQLTYRNCIGSLHMEQHKMNQIMFHAQSQTKGRELVILRLGSSISVCTGWMDK